MTFRTSLSWRLMILLLAAEAAAILPRGVPWLGEWNWTIDWLNGGTLVLGPLVGACSAFDAAQVFGPADNWLKTFVRGWTVPARVAAANALAGALAHAGVLSAGVVASIIVGAGGLPDARFFLPPFVMVGACACIGAALGFFLKHVLAAPLAGGVLFGATVLGADASSPLRVFRAGGSTGTLVGLTWSGVNLIVACMSLFILGAACVGLVVGVRALPRGRLVAVTIPAAAVAVLGSGLLVVGTDSERFSASSDSQKYLCEGSSPRVCLDERTSRGLKDLSSRMAAAASILNAYGVQAPAQFSQVVGGVVPPDSAPLFVESTEVNRSQTPADRVAVYLTVPSLCAELTGPVPPPMEYYAVQRLLQTLILLRQQEVSLKQLQHDEYVDWLAQSPADQESWVETTYSQLVDCQFDAVRLPMR